MIGIAGKFTAIALFVCASLGATACAADPAAAQAEHWTWGTVAEDSDYAAQTRDIRLAFTLNDFAALDALEVKYRDTDRLMPSGASKLELYYENMISLLAKYDPLRECNANWQPFLDKWRAASPNSPAPIIANAAMLDSRASCYRGEGYASTVPEDAWKPYHDNIAAAYALLIDGKAIASNDPEYYAELENLAVARGSSSDDFRHLLDQAIARYPDYSNIYYAAYAYYQPQWYGSNAEVDALARLMAEKTRSHDGTSGYFRLYWHAALCHCTENLAPVDWPTMRVAMADLAARYPVDRTYIHLVQMACMLGQVDTARTYFAKLTVNEADYWKQADWETCRVLVGPSPLPFPAPAS